MIESGKKMIFARVTPFEPFDERESAASETSLVAASTHNGPFDPCPRRGMRHRTKVNAANAHLCSQMSQTLQLVAANQLMALDVVGSNGTIDANQSHSDMPR